MVLSTGNFPIVSAKVSANSISSGVYSGLGTSTDVYKRQGFDGVDKRVDVLATAIRGSMTGYDLAELEDVYKRQITDITVIRSIILCGTSFSICRLTKKKVSF